MKRQSRPPERFATAHFRGSYDRTAGGTLPPPPPTAVSAGRERANQFQFQAGRISKGRLSAILQSVTPRPRNLTPVLDPRPRPVQLLKVLGP
jgi:hypothetical protein